MTPRKLDRPCAECGRTGITGGSSTLCVSCWKRLVWRPANGLAVERDRRSSREAKRRRRAEARAA